MEDIRRSTTSLGTVTGVLPYGRAAGHVKHITVRLACQHPMTIPHFVKYHRGNRAARVRIILLQSRPWQDGPYPLDQDAWPVDVQYPVQAAPSSSSSSSSTQGSVQNEGGAPSNSSGASNNMFRRRAIGLRGVWRVKPKLKQIWVKKVVPGSREVVEMVATPKVIQLPVTKQGEATQIATQQEGLSVVYKRQEGQIQIFRGQCLLGMINLDSQVVPVLAALIPETIKSTVLEMENTNKIEQVFAKHAPISAQRYIPLNAKDAAKEEGKRGMSSEYRIVAQSNTKASERRLTWQKVAQ